MSATKKGFIIDIDGKQYYKSTDDDMKLFEIKQKIFDKQSKYQHIQVYETERFGNILVLDGDIQFSSKDEYIYHEMMAHVPSVYIKKMSNVLIIGGGDGGCVRELLKHKSINKIYVIDIDIEVIDVCKRYFPKVANGLSDSRVQVITKDANEWVKLTENIEKFRSYFDLVIMDVTDFGSSDPLFKDDFYKNLKRFMSRNSVFVTNGAVVDCISIYRSIIGLVKQLRLFFKYCFIYSAPVPIFDCNYGFVICSDFVNPMNSYIDHQRFRRQGIKTKYYTDKIHTNSFILPKKVKKSLKILDTKLSKMHLGNHITIDMVGIPDTIIRDHDFLIRSLRGVVQMTKMKELGISYHKFGNDGFTCTILLSTSHIAIHTFPEVDGRCCLDLYTCKQREDLNTVIDFLLETLNPRKYDVKYVERII
jgi:spermidine synthase